MKTDISVQPISELTDEQKRARVAPLLSVTVSPGSFFESIILNHLRERIKESQNE